MSTALVNLYRYRQLIGEDKYRIILSIHDAVMLEVPVQHVAQVCEEVFPICMVHNVEVPGTGLHYGLGAFDIMERWGEETSPERLEELGVTRDWCGYK